MLINFAFLFVAGIINLNFKLRISEHHGSRGRYSWSHFRFAVLDLDSSESYPGNFVSMLPMKIDSTGKTQSAFTKFFGDKSLKIARNLLTESLKEESGSEIKAEIRRRLNLLEPNPVVHIKCRTCKKFFETRKENVRRQFFCPECRKAFFRKK